MEEIFFLEDISIAAGNTELNNNFNVLVKNNIEIQNLAEPEEDKDSANRQFQAAFLDPLLVSLYVPEDTYDLLLDRNYTFVEQSLASGTDDDGSLIDIVDNKSRANISLSKTFSGIDLADEQTVDFVLSKTAKVLNTEDFTKQTSLSGFLIAPDLRPILFNGYRATVALSMTIKVQNDEELRLQFFDLKTANESPLTNIFTFSFLPIGLYDALVNFDADRNELLQDLGVVEAVSEEEETEN